MATRKLVCDTECANDFVDVCNYAVIELTEELVCRIESIWRSLQDLNAHGWSDFILYDLHVVYFDTHAKNDEEFALSDRIEGAIANGSPVSEDWGEFAEPIPENWFQRTECDRMVISSGGTVWWQAIPKHGDYTVETASIEIKDLRREHAEAQ